MSKTTTSAEGRNLILTRVIDAPAAKVFEAWTSPESMKQWFAPRPYTTPVVELDLRAGGSQLVVMRGPDGTDFPPMHGVYLEVVKDRKIVFTDAYSSAWVPSEKPFMTVTATFDEVDGKTNYKAVVSHWSDADLKAHEDMGFHQGWATVAEQLAALVETK
jgi:uncharacterized protein YndB with AHSA1/START domain